MGYHLAGFEVYGIDNQPQPRYPFPFLRMDALEAMDRLLRGEGLTFSNGETLYLAGFVVVHASPPCQKWSEITPPYAKVRHPDLITPMRQRLLGAGVPFIIENVECARHMLIDPLMLCGTMFNLPIWRHRYFETDGFSVPRLEHFKHTGRPPIVINPGSNARRNRIRRTTEEQATGMEVDWMTRMCEITEAIPPAYTEYIGAYLLSLLDGAIDKPLKI